MWIAPDTDIHILAAVPLDKTYDHTIFWNNANDQANYFISKAKWTLADHSYQRVQRGFIRVDIQAEKLYDCNYLMFRNTAFGTKWFYAFIKSVEYINNRVSQMEFEIDVMQTWFFDYTLDKCYVEREHTTDDGLYAHILEENLNLGSEYTCNRHDIIDLGDMAVCALINKNTEAGQNPGRYISGMYTPLHVSAGIPANNPHAVDAVLSQYLEDEIVAVYEYPLIFGDGSTTVPYSHLYTYNKWATHLNGYVPRNRKLFSYPYNFLLISNNSGQTAQYRWEDFNGAQASFVLRGTFVSTVCAFLYPTAYRGMAPSFDDGIMLSNFPQCAWSGDTFKAWWAQNKASFVTSGITSVLSDVGKGVAAGSVMTPLAGVVVGAGSVLSDINHSMAQIHDIKSTPNQTHGQTQSDSINAGIGRIRFDLYSMSIKAEQAAAIDDYFDRYGYACKRNKIPNRNVRPHWTFTKTMGCTITGSIPSDDAVAICNIYNNGVTFWNNPYEVGNYNLDNTV